MTNPGLFAAYYVTHVTNKNDALQRCPASRCLNSACSIAMERVNNLSSQVPKDLAGSRHSRSPPFPPPNPLAALKID